MSAFLYQHPSVSAIADLYDPIREGLPKDVAVRDQLAAFSKQLLQAHQAQDPVCVPEINNWHLGLVGKSAEEVLTFDFQLSDAQETHARQFGFADWATVETYKERLNPLFEDTVDALMVGDEEYVRSQLEAHPDLIHARSSYGHRATLLLYLGTNGVETWRQQVPHNMIEMLQLLLEKGADPQAKMAVYGGHFTTKEMVGTSGHTQQAGIMEEMLAILGTVEGG